MVNINIQEENAIKIYIIVPVFNTCEYLFDCIESVLEEKTLDIRLILIDDGSTDESGKICDDYANSDNRVTVIHQKNQGQIIARQVGIRYVLAQNCNKTRDVVMFLDSDDTLKQTTLSEVNKVMKDFSIDMMLFGMDRVINGKIVEPYNANGRYSGIIENKRDLYRIVFNDWAYNPVCGKAIRVSLLKNDDYNDYGDVRYGEDLIQSIEYYKKSRKAFFYNKSLYNYTINPNSMTQTINNKPYSVDFRVRQLVMDFLVHENVFDEQDWKVYRTFCMWLIADMLRTICLLNIQLNKKIDLIKEMWYSDYYCMYLHDKKYNKLSDWWSSFSCFLFSKKQFAIIVVVGSLYKKLREIRNRIRGY